MENVGERCAVQNRCVFIGVCVSVSLSAQKLNNEPMNCEARLAALLHKHFV